MKIACVPQFSDDCQALIYPITSDWADWSVLATATGVSEALLREEVKGEKGEITPFFADERRVFIVGLGKDPRSSDIIRALRTVVFRHKAKLSAVIGVEMSNLPAAWAEFVANGVRLAEYDFGLYKTDTKPAPVWAGPEGRLELHLAADASAAIRKGEILAETQLQLFRLLNAPANHKNPRTLASWAMQSGDRYGYSVRVFDAGECQAMGLASLLAVGQGSPNEAGFIVMEYKGEGASQTVGLVGKGVTFDTGGISIKPSENMHLMKSDMGGAAAVLGTMEAAARLGLPVRLVGIVPTTENSIDGESMKPGDVIPSYAGKTIEVTDTDAEGRLILADGLAYCVKNYQPDVLIDLATLTGSVIRTLGYQAAGLFTNNDKLGKQLKRAGEHTGERLWRLPLWEEYAEHLKSDVADIRNFSGLPHSQAIAAAKFLEAFTEGHSAWAHLDIAGTAYGDTDFAPQRAGTAYGVRLLIDFLERQIVDI